MKHTHRHRHRHTDTHTHTHTHTPTHTHTGRQTERQPFVRDWDVADTRVLSYCPHKFKSSTPNLSLTTPLTRGEILYKTLWKKHPQLSCQFIVNVDKSSVIYCLAIWCCGGLSFVYLGTNNVVISTVNPYTYWSNIWISYNLGSRAS